MGRRRRFAAILSLVIGVILFFPIYSFGEDKILARELLVDGKKFSVDIKAEELLKKCFGEIDKRFEDKEERDLAKNIFFITTAEIALVNHVQLTGLKDLPAKITESNVLLGVMKSDTIEGFKCPTMVRITKKKVVRSRDFFTFISDVDRVWISLGKAPLSEFLDNLKNPDKFIPFIESHSAYMAESTISAELAPALAKSNFYKISGYLWFLKASFVFQKEPGQIKSEVEKVKKSLKLN